MGGGLRTQKAKEAEEGAGRARGLVMAKETHTEKGTQEDQKETRRKTRHCSKLKPVKTD